MGEGICRSWAHGDSQPMAVIAFLSALVLWGVLTVIYCTSCLGQALGTPRRKPLLHGRRGHFFSWGLRGNVFPVFRVPSG